MKVRFFTKFILISSISFFIFSCDDGDIITFNLDFDMVLERCPEDDMETNNYVVYDTKDDDPYESLTLLFPSNTTNDKIFNPEETPLMGTLNINGSSVRFNYRIYNGSPQGLICQDIPDASVSILEDYESSSGTADYVSTFVDDDNDGILTSIEDANLDGDNDPDTNPTDSDGDGIPDYKDADDDNDNVLTIDEDPDPNGDEDIVDAKDTDGDGTPDYLDTDDDGDGTITRYEDANGNGNLFDDFEVGATVPRFLDNTISDVFINDNLNPNAFTRTINVEFTINNIDIEILSADSFLLGNYTREITF